MKKTILTAMFAFSILPFMASAQTVSPDTQTLINQLKTLLIQEIQYLQAELDALNGSPVSVPALQVIPQQTSAPVVAAAPAPQVTTPTPIAPDVAFGATDCSSGKPVVPISFTMPYNSLMVQIGEQRNSYTTPLKAIDYIPSGDYTYHVKAWTGATRPFTENTWEDARTLVLDTTGSLSIASCQ